MRNPRFFLSCLSAVLLAVIYPKLGWAPLAWIALIPLYMLLIRCETPRQASKWAFISGVLFFLLSMHWLVHVSLFGLCVVAFFLASFWLFLGWMNGYLMRSKSIGARTFSFAAIWMLIEICRAEIPVVGLGWNLLAYSQSPVESVLQFANLAGVYGLGFMMAWFNALLAEALLGYLEIGRAHV